MGGENNIWLDWSLIYYNSWAIKDINFDPSMVKISQMIKHCLQIPKAIAKKLLNTRGPKITKQWQNCDE
jgi:hypothetical protein